MSRRRSPLFVIATGLTVTCALTLWLLLPTPAAAQSGSSGAPSAKPWSPPRTLDGQPDIQGIWTNSTLTQLERPEAFASKPVISQTEAEAYERNTLTTRNRDRRDGGADADVNRAYNELFFDQGDKLARVDNTIRTSMIVDPPDGKIPALTPQAKQKQDAIRAEALLHPADTPRDRSLSERCIFWATAGPPMLPGPYNNNYQIVQAPGYVMIQSEMIHETRVIPLDGRPHLPASTRLWLGDSRGHWDGNTLVVDTTNFNGKARFRGSDENLHVIERFTRTGPNAIMYKFTIEDPTAFTKPWTAELPLLAASGPIYEYACHEGNYAMVDMLAGARADEKNGK
jgi:hypothetical protein